jgi:hypothetical protein
MIVYGVAGIAPNAQSHPLHCAPLRARSGSRAAQVAGAGWRWLALAIGTNPWLAEWLVCRAGRLINHRHQVVNA